MTTSGGSHGPSWYPDPEGRHEYRWYDGTAWTDQVSDHGRLSTAPLTGTTVMPASDVAPERIAKNLASAGVQVGAVQGGGTLSRADWRRDNVNRFVERLYRESHAIAPTVRVGISPFGIWRPKIPTEIIAGLDVGDRCECLNARGVDDRHHATSGNGAAGAAVRRRPRDAEELACGIVQQDPAIEGGLAIVEDGDGDGESRFLRGAVS